MVGDPEMIQVDVEFVAQRSQLVWLVKRPGVGEIETEAGCRAGVVRWW